MTVTAFDTPHGWVWHRLGRVMARSRRDGLPGLDPLSVFLEIGVVPRSERDDNHNQLGADLGKYLVVEPGDLVFNKLRTWQGGFGASKYTGIVSPAYYVLRPSSGVDSRFIDYLLHSSVYLSELTRLSKWMPPSQFDMPWEDLKSLPVPLPPLDVQGRIADFLDDQVGRIDRLGELRRGEQRQLEEYRRAALTEVMFAEQVAVVPLGARAHVRLGRQRSPEHERGEHMVPYLRSANVVDGCIRTDDVKTMNFSPQEQRLFLLEPGDVLVTEGAGSPESVGASAVYRGQWSGPLCFQNTLVRLRPRAGLDADYLGWWARSSHAAGAMRNYATGANILHIGAEGLRRMPMPARSLNDQCRVARECSAIDLRVQDAREAIATSILLLQERRRSLITAAVTGEFDVSTASSRAADVALSGVGGVS